MDRLNLHFKIGNDIVIKFTDEEMEMVESIRDDVNTFEDVLEYYLKVKSLKDTKQSNFGDLLQTLQMMMVINYFQKILLNQIVMIRTNNMIPNLRVQLLLK